MCDSRFIRWQYRIHSASCYSYRIESVCSVIKLIMRDKFKGNIFIITFFANVIIAVLFVFIGDSLGLDLYYVILLALGFKLLQDLDVVKTYIFTK